MARFGYHISNLTRREKYEEIEHILDKRLKGWDKPPTPFESDGTVRQQYIKSTEDGTQTEVTLVKNITESNITVYSDIELKFLKFDGALLLLRDIPPMVLFIILHYAFIGNKISESIRIWQIEKILPTYLVCIIILTIINLLTLKPLSVRRERARVRIIQLGGPATIISFFAIMFYLVKDWDFYGTFIKLISSPCPAVWLSLFLACKINKNMR